MEDKPVSMEAASLSHQHWIPPAKQGRGGMGACFGPNAGVLPVSVGFSAWPLTASAAVGKSARSVAHLRLVQPYFTPKAALESDPSPLLAQPALAPPANLVIKAMQSK